MARWAEDPTLLSPSSREMSKLQPRHFLSGYDQAEATEIKTVRVPSSDLTMRLEGGEIYLFARDLLVRACLPQT
jgi:hypothetical protein